MGYCLQFDLIYFIADILNMVKSIKKRSAIYSHPRKHIEDFVVYGVYISGINQRVLQNCQIDANAGSRPNQRTVDNQLISSRDRSRPYSLVDYLASSATPSWLNDFWDSKFV